IGAHCAAGAACSRCLGSHVLMIEGREDVSARFGETATGPPTRHPQISTQEEGEGLATLPRHALAPPLARIRRSVSTLGSAARPANARVTLTLTRDATGARAIRAAAARCLLRGEPARNDAARLS